MNAATFDTTICIAHQKYKLKHRSSAKYYELGKTTHRGESAKIQNDIVGPCNVRVL